MTEVVGEFWRAYLYSSHGHWSGLAVTLWLLVLSVSIGFCASLFLSVGRVSARRWLSFPIWLFTYLFRGTPLYVQILFFYSGMFSLGFVKDTTLLAWLFGTGFNCMVLALALNDMAYTTEIFSGAIRETSKGEIESARAYGMTRFTMYRRIILPSALRRAWPAYSNEIILVLHGTSLAFTVTVTDVLAVAQDANFATYRTFESYGLAAVIYLCVSFALFWLFHRIERRMMPYLKAHG